MDIMFVYITIDDLTQAQAIGRTLINERMAACVNVFNNMLSFYRWEGKTCEESEVVLIAKTRQSLVEVLTRRVKELHPYSCPCIIALPVSGGNQDFIDWIRRETEV